MNEPLNRAKEALTIIQTPRKRGKYDIYLANSLHIHDGQVCESLSYDSMVEIARGIFTDYSMEGLPLFICASQRIQGAITRKYTRPFSTAGFTTLATLRVPKSLNDRLKRVAGALGRSCSDIRRESLEHGISAYEESGE